MGSKKSDKLMGIHQQPWHRTVEMQPGAQEVPPYRASEAGETRQEKGLLSPCSLLCSYASSTALLEPGHEAGQGFVLTQRSHYHHLILSLSSLQTTNWSQIRLSPLPLEGSPDLWWPSKGTAWFSVSCPGFQQWRGARYVRVSTCTARWLGMRWGP